MSGVFLNYRTGDGDWAAALIKRELSDRFGSGNVFYAGQSIRLGEDFTRQILGRLRRSEVMLALIGPRWLTAENRGGGRRLDDPDDWVRRELGEAFQVGLRVIPVLLDGIDRIAESALPDDIAQLARCQYLRMHHRSDDFDLTRLVDELVELVPGLLLAAPTSTRPAVPGPVYPGPCGELHSMATRLRQALANPAGSVAVWDIVQVAAGQALEALEARAPTAPRYVDDDDIPVVLEEWLSSFERDMAPLLRVCAIGLCSGDRRHDDLWITVVKRFLDRPSRSGEPEFWAAAEAYPSLLLVYALGVAGMAAGREEVVYRIRQVPVVRGLALRQVVDPRFAAALSKWAGAAPYQPLSVHLRHSLHPAFFNVVSDEEYESSFEDYEYLRSLLELHDGPFSSLGEFAVNIDKGNTDVHRRMAARLATDSALLRAGAFDGNAGHVTEARRALNQSIYGRYP